MHVSNTNQQNQGGIKMELSTIICTLKDIIFPVFGIMAAAILATCIPGIAAVAFLLTCNPAAAEDEIVFVKEENPSNKSSKTNTQKNNKKELYIMKRITSLILALATILAIATPAFAQDITADEPDYINYEIVENEDQAIDTEEAVQTAPDYADIEDYVAVNEDESLITDTVVAIMYMCVSGAHTKYIFGHTWICIKNVSDKAIRVGNAEIAPGSMASFGLHHFDGLHYDDEMNDYRGETVSATEYQLTSRELKAAEEEITNSRWHWYEYLTHNCTNFATSVWKKVTGKGYFAFCFPFVVQIQMAGAGLKKIVIERQDKKLSAASEMPALATPTEA
jgi:hypothetical protein